MKEKKTDILIIGGGASGMMSAIIAKRIDPENHIILMESSFALGRKLLISGAGRGNILNSNLAQKDYQKYFHSNLASQHFILYSRNI
jgi:predicted flavoprotein YhiN